METHQNFVESLGLKLVETVVDRRGSVVLKVARDGQIFALKCSNPNVEDTYDRGKLIQHEAAILKEINSLVADQYVDSGEDEVYGAWMLLHWIDGETVSSTGKRLRSIADESSCVSFQKLFTSIARTYAPIHEKGFLHGDVQPPHVFIEQETGQVVLLDWGLGQRIGSADNCYRGGFVHYAAPEIAKGTLEQSEHIEYDVLAEVYSLGAMFYFLYTGETAVDYGPGEMMQIPFQQKLEAVAEGRLRGFKDTDSECEAQLQDVIKKCLAADPSSRYSSVAQLLNALQQIQSN